MAAYSETVVQIDCNNPNVDYSVVATFGDGTEPVVTSAGKNITANQEDEVPYACPLTRGDSEHRLVEDFIQVCQDCPHSFVSHAIGQLSIAS